MECKRCGNTDKNYFYKGHKGIYCRKCVSFKRILLEEEQTPLDYEVSREVSDYYFAFPLTVFQEDIALKCLRQIKESDVLLHCVCGAGKTEIVVRSIEDYLKRGLKVCYAISRREVVKELYIRFQKIFPDAEVVAVYGGHHDRLTGDLIVCTTHQLFRYYQTFDLLVLDEVDAFPLSGNKELMHIALNSARGNIIFSTATVNDFLRDVLKERNYKELKLYIRPSLKPMIVPKVYYGLKPYLGILLFFLLKRMDKQCIIFVSTRKECRTLYHIYRCFFNCTYVYSDLDKRDENIMAFKDKKYQHIFATTVLERGITIKDVNVIVMNLHKGIFAEENIIQMLGRVGRNYANPNGEAYILSRYRTKDIRNSVGFIKEANELSEMSLL